MVYTQALVSSFIQSPKLAGVLLSLIPFTVILMSAVGWWSASASKRADQVEGKTSTSVEQVISATRIVQSFGIADRLLIKLELELFRPIKKLGLLRATGKALEQTSAFFVTFLTYSLAFW
jgi:ABC-type multidrug transport system fused ATPase/permease subunit